MSHGLLAGLFIAGDIQPGATTLTLLSAEKKK
jgi:hypothetical protein